ncbi:MAG: hypothetical protein BWY78_01161 [Alphaproteobacteria bacterium ADurb.Bin438]|nr:MAG: hypothetical protein BWY78_01161 [Alphaproteobacteria bacterium ADurb.Bin438]
MSFNSHELSDSEKQLAEAIFRIMLNDTALSVRKALSENLKSNNEIPHDVVVQMAHDVDEVAIPIISYSQILSDEDLISVVKTKNENKQVAVASRSIVNEIVTEVLADEGTEKAVAVMVGNQGAKISDTTLNKVVEKFKDSDIVKNPLALRNELPLVVVEKLISMVSQDLKKHLVKSYKISNEEAEKITTNSREKVTVSAAYMATDSEVRGLIEQLSNENKLTPSIIFRSLCMGDVKFFEYSMLKLTSLPVHNVRVLIYDSGELGLKGLFDKARLPAILFPAMKAAIEVALETELDGGDKDVERFRRRVAERVLTKLDNSGIDLQDSDVEYILDKIDGLPASFLEIFK